MSTQDYATFHRETGSLVRWRGATRSIVSPAVVRIVFSVVAGACDALAILSSAVVTWVLYHYLAYPHAQAIPPLGAQGYVMAALFIVSNMMRREYMFSNYLGFRSHLRRTVVLWNVAFASTIMLAFLAKTSADFSRGAMVFFYVGGLSSVLLMRLALVRIVADRSGNGSVAQKRIYLVGFEEEIERFNETYKPSDIGMRVVAASVLRGPDSLRDDLALAAASARVLRPEEVFILVPWSNRETIEACISSFMLVPAAIHLGPERVLDRFRDVHIERIGNISTLHLVRRPLSTLEIVTKRAFDIVAGSLALVLLSPLLLLVAIAVRLDSNGPAFFLQRRYGFNQMPFNIIKFRSMTTMDNGRSIQQATANDTRITRLGRILRRCNIDELPQLLNVVRGDMSLVGPRPHAMAHDQHYIHHIALYARRHNVKPGITGWAQVNGYRGETDTEQKMRARVEHDLAYIDNWSLWLDVKIMLLTVFSRKAYSNAG
ncbi:MULTISPECIES: undecaprenyl-phosphate glucose phosphotransferase [unclassified Beijerinckia]|uniref:undecaprenyl-phosphate glucose phosphotransferase n=1 Tax=unclassified Beijerinckia TaxID=2638183 RepID=UPI00089A35E2|nr:MULTISPECIES: undecaprenyl-phosphate glucose phosphotransferase [unclassified Beijerinckia]MDH7794188.1 Undecaprenyl-phosphate glucose phosphotransferase [Beijerinckia sp. GAS462]SEB55322.1 Undecaprenyl-phosphate glucose phosphotransferase [Beijerinckia sp. 28-YEA-48]